MNQDDVKALNLPFTRIAAKGPAVDALANRKESGYATEFPSVDFTENISVRNHKTVKALIALINKNPVGD